MSPCTALKCVEVLASDQRSNDHRSEVGAGHVFVCLEPFTQKFCPTWTSIRFFFLRVYRGKIFEKTIEKHAFSFSAKVEITVIVVFVGTSIYFCLKNLPSV